MTSPGKSTGVMVSDGEAEVGSEEGVTAGVNVGEVKVGVGAIELEGEGVGLDEGLGALSMITIEIANATTMTMATPRTIFLFLVKTSTISLMDKLYLSIMHWKFEILAMFACPISLNKQLCRIGV